MVVKTSSILSFKTKTKAQLELRYHFPLQSLNVLSAIDKSDELQWYTSNGMYIIIIITVQSFIYEQTDESVSCNFQVCSNPIGSTVIVFNRISSSLKPSSALKGSEHILLTSSVFGTGLEEIIECLNSVTVSMQRVNKRNKSCSGSSDSITIVVYVQLFAFALQ
ncbi:hypothetical protein C8Q75DRAFT_737590 [Abortiporus biennis]|nr:hypothetical protein C8Q75DRAFT_737590 [Abortiporus biennis]